jgi:PadR family transcriptional regulator, regulatory protein AphA
MSGYDLRKEVATSIGYFWSESYGQIYPSLRALRSKGWIRRQRGGDHRETDRTRHVYEITREGRKALAAWRALPPGEIPVRNELLLKLFFGTGSTVALEKVWIGRLETRERAALETYAKIRVQLLSEQRRHPSLPFWLMTLSYGEHRSRSVIRWCRTTRRALDALRRRTKEARFGS